MIYRVVRGDPKTRGEKINNDEQRIEYSLSKTNNTQIHIKNHNNYSIIQIRGIVRLETYK